MPTSQSDHHFLSESYRLIARGMAAVAAGTGLIVILGWLLQINVLKSILPSWISMKPESARLFILSGCGLWLALSRSHRLFTGRAAQVIGALVLLGGIVTVAEYASGLDFGIDQWLIRESPGAPGTAFPGRMSLVVASSFVLTGWTLIWFRKGGAWRVIAPALLVTCIALVSITGYLYDEVTLQRIGPQFTAMHSAIAFLLLSLGIEIGQPRSGVMRLFGSRGPEGVLLRRLVPAVLLVPLGFGWVILAGTRVGLYSVTAGWSLFALATAVALAIFTGLSASYLRRSDRSLRVTMATLRAILESIDAPLFSVDRSLRYTHFNQAHAAAMKSIYGVKVEIGGSYPDFQTVDRDRSESRRDLERALAGERMTVSTTGGSPAAGQRYFEITHNPISSDTGEILGVSVFAHDITIHKQAEELVRKANVDLERSLEQEKDLLGTVIDSLPDLVFVKDADGRFVLVNRALAEKAGVGNPTELLGKTDAAVVPREVAEKYAADDRRIMETGVAMINSEELFAPSDSGPRWLLTTKVPLRDHTGKVSGVVGISRDITDRKAMEEQMQQSQKLESLGVLAGGIAHDFNNILAVVLGNAEVAAQNLAPESTAWKHVDEIAKASQRAADLCRQMLAYSGQGSFDIQPLDLSEVIREMQQMLHMAISKKSSLRLSLAADLPAVELDVAQMRQIALNLVMNASEAMGDKGGEIRVSTAAVDCDRAYLDSAWGAEPLAEGRYVTMEVEDSGTGMDEATKARIFEPFFTTKFTGRGLGLSAVLGIVRRHGGAIRVYSEPGKGSTFKLLFPASVTRPRIAAPTRGSCGEWQGHGTILLVDDEEGVRHVGSAMLETLGFCVLTAADGAGALDVYRAHRDEITCVLLDMTMPRIGGAETFQALREMDPNVRVLLCSGYSEQHVSQQFSGAGPAGFIQKPYRMATLQEKLRRIVGE